jgi:pimeloyl-ACP methyl ester carboxylesterase
MSIPVAEPVHILDGPLLAVRHLAGPLRPLLLVHDAGRDAQDWDDVSVRLAATGHEVAAPDLRGHGASQAPALLDGEDTDTYDTDTCADDLAALIERLGWTGGRAPVVAGHGWGAAVALSLAARRGGVAGLACLDGGWARPVEPVAEPVAGTAGGPAVRDAVATAVARTQPRAFHGLVRVPVLLAAAGATGATGATGADPALADAEAALPRVRVVTYAGVGHELPLKSAARVTDDLLDLALRCEPAASLER